MSHTHQHLHCIRDLYDQNHSFRLSRNDWENDRPQSETYATRNLCRKRSHWKSDTYRLSAIVARELRHEPNPAGILVERRIVEAQVLLRNLREGHGRPDDAELRVMPRTCGPPLVGPLLGAQPLTEELVLDVDHISARSLGGGAPASPAPVAAAERADVLPRGDGGQHRRITQDLQRRITQDLQRRARQRGHPPTLDPLSNWKAYVRPAFQKRQIRQQAAKVLDRKSGIGTTAGGEKEDRTEMTRRTPKN